MPTRTVETDAELDSLIRLLQTYAKPYVVSITKGKRRSLEQNDLLFGLLRDLSDQVEWPVNGAMVKLPPEDWKVIMTAGLRSENRIAQGISGGLVVLGKRTSKMSKAELSDLIELVRAFGSERRVVWFDTVEQRGA